MDDSDIDDIPSPPGSIPLGEGASAGAESMIDEEDMLYYVPERRPSLDLGDVETPMDTNYWGMDKVSSPVESYSSMISEDFHQSDEMDDQDKSSTRIHLERTDSYSSCYSLDSNDCEIRTRKVRSKEDDISEPPERPELIRNPNETSHPSLTVGFTFKAISKTLEKLSMGELKIFKMSLWKRYPESFNTPPQGMDMVDLVDRLLECYDREVSLQVTKALLEEMDKHRLVEYLQDLRARNEVRFELSMTLKKKYGELCEDLGAQGEKVAIDSVFSNPYITTPWDNGPNYEHEIRKIQSLNKSRKTEKQRSLKDIFSVKMLKDDHVRCLLTPGMAGTGKSTVVQKFILDWAEERSHTHISLVIPLPFRELNTFRDSPVSLHGIINTLYPETTKLKNLTNEENAVLIICDGLDEFYQEPNFIHTEYHCDSKEPVSLDVLIVNLIRGKLFFDGVIWITSRPLRSHVFPGDIRRKVLEIRGFNDTQKEEFFKRRFEDPVQAAQVISHLESCKTLHIMCHLPLFCSVLNGIFQHAFREQGPQAQLPSNLTYMYTKLLLALLHRRSLRAPACSVEEQRNFLMKLGKMALIMLEKNEIRVPKSYWKDNGVDKVEAVVNSAICTQFIMEEFILMPEKVQSFIHSTMQEYMAALYVFLSFRNQGKNVLEHTKMFSRVFKAQNVFELYKCAVEKSLLCEDGRLDIFLRFLLGMAPQTNQELLQPFFTSSVKWPSVIEDAATLIRKKIRENQYPNRNANLQQCLRELGVSEAASR
ncbi:NLR family CARD domain-containing protein 3 [Myripristis murdjan]|uniref:NLR family CARD domain-containing protein 3-like n=1 Tax=Myripristis murdjan TaxID=586833 RepID=A0A668A5E7_9TELE|nr:NLR family CARD domain-containing protein 3-like [Myripristis murdjan]